MLPVLYWPLDVASSRYQALVLRFDHKHLFKYKNPQDSNSNPYFRIAGYPPYSPTLELQPLVKLVAAFSFINYIFLAAPLLVTSIFSSVTNYRHFSADLTPDSGNFSGTIKAQDILVYLIRTDVLSKFWS